MFKKVEHLGGICFVSEDGQVKDLNGIVRKWFYNQDGYPCVSLKGAKGWRSVGVHILVAKAYVENPLNKKEVNHKDFNRKNPCSDNLEWVTHQENIEYSFDAGRYKGKFGEANPNFNNHTLKKKYAEDKTLSLLKQSRPGKQNGRAKPCALYENNQLIGYFDYQKQAFDKLVELGVCKELQVATTVIHYLKTPKGYKGYFLYLA